MMPRGSPSAPVPVEIEAGFGMTTFGIATVYIGLTIAFGKADPLAQKTRAIST
jgi:hypothetical protein